jgi:hypothetical protein
MIEGKAVGGPLGGAKITAPVSWDGTVKQQGGNPVKLYPGHYKRKKSGDGMVWKWVEEVNKGMTSEPMEPTVDPAEAERQAEVEREAEAAREAEADRQRSEGR